MKIEIPHVKLSDIEIGKSNPRKEFEEISLDELTESIRLNGVIQPVLLRPAKTKGKYELVCGERRYRACISIRTAFKSRDSIPAVVRNITDEEALVLQLAENLHRRDVHPMEEAVGFKNLIDFKKLDANELAKRLGKSSHYIAQRLKLNDLIDEFATAFYKKRMELGTALKICKLSAKDQQDLWNSEYKNEAGEISINSWVLKKYMNDLNDAPFDTKDENLIKGTKACTNCQFNSAANTVLFPEDASVARCLNSSCYREKTETSYNIQLNQVKDLPDVVMITDSIGVYGKRATDLKKKGAVVYNGNEYRQIRLPEAPTFEEFKEDNSDYYENEADLKTAFDKEIEEYTQEVAEYEEKVSSGKYLKAFVIEGNDAGKFRFITLNKAAAKSNASKKTDDDEIKPKAEIERLTTLEKRKKELDDEKAQLLFQELMTKDKVFPTSDANLVLEEKIGLLVMLSEYGHYGTGDRTYKALGIKGSYDYSYLNFYKHITTLSEKDLEKAFNRIVRILLQTKLILPTSAQARPSNNGKAAALVDILHVHQLKAVTKIQQDQQIEIDKRVSRFNQRIEELKNAGKTNKGKEKVPGLNALLSKKDNSHELDTAN